MSQTNTQVDIPEPPPAPREISGLVRQRTWNDPRVRFWWLAGFILLLITLGFSIVQLQHWRKTKWLVEHGTSIQATVIVAGGTDLAIQRVSPLSRVILQFPLQGKDRTVDGYLEGRVEMISPKQVITIRIDPDDFRRWTYRTQAEPLGRELIGEIVAAPAVLLAFAIALLYRWRLLNIWRTGQAYMAVIVESRQTAIAPLSRMALCAPRDGFDRKLVVVYLPSQLGRHRRGDALWLLSPRGKSSPVVAADVLMGK